jgi:hypothetical protein
MGEDVERNGSGLIKKNCPLIDVESLRKITKIVIMTAGSSFEPMIS